MADGDIFDQHGRLWWKTSARKLFTSDPTFEGSAIWSIDKMFRDGNLTALPNLAQAITESIVLRKQGIDSGFLLDIRLRALERMHWDLDSQTAFGVAREIVTDPGFGAEIKCLDGDRLAIRVAQEVLARVVVETCSMPDLVHAMHHEPGLFRLSREKFHSARKSGVQLLGRAESVKQRVTRRLQTQQGPVEAPVLLTRPRASVDQRALVHEAFSV